MKPPQFVTVVMYPRPLYVAIATLLGRPHYGQFTIVVRVPESGMDA